MAHATPQLLQTQMALDPKDRPKYSAEQLQTYFKRIHLPQKHLSSLILQNPSLARTKPDGLPLLQALVRHHVAHIPFENLEIHYSSHKTISLQMDDLFTKFASRGLQYGRGGRCMENNGFFGTVLRSLGYDVRNCAGRVSRALSGDPEVRDRQGQTYDGWNHMLNLVRLDGGWYVVDVGMSAWGPNLVYPLVDGFECESIAPRRIRLQWRSIAEHAAEREEEAQKLWCFDVCHHAKEEGREEKWVPTYCFTETEFLPQDYEMMSWYTSTNPRSFFTHLVLGMKMEMDEAGEKIIGDVSLLKDTVRRTHGPLLGGRKEVLKTCETEGERVEALREFLGVELTEEERKNVKTGSALGN